MRTLTIVFLGLLLAALAFADKKASSIPTTDVARDIGPVAQSPPTDDMWDLLSWAPSPFADLLGCEFAGGYFYITGNAGGPPNMVYIFDRAGNLVGQFEQWSSPGWGWRDLVFDGTYLYGSDDTVIDAFDLEGNPMPGMNINGPISLCRALAYDEFTDHFWTQNFNGLLYEFGRDGAVYWSGTSGATAAGAAFDNGAPDGPWLWIFSQTGMPPTTFHKFDPVNHVPTGFVYQLQLLPGLTDQIAGGAFFTEELDPAYWVMGGTVQGTPYGGLFLLEMYPNVPDTFDVTITLTNYTPNPWAYLNFDVQLTNNEAFPVTFDAWLVVTLPSGLEIPLIRRELTFAAGQSVTRNLTIDIPASAPAGTYTMTGCTGNLPDVIWDSDFFTFDKLGSSDGPAIAGFDPAMLTVTGWDEPWETSLGAAVLSQFEVLGNYPNPFNQTTTIRFSLPEAANVTLTIYDVNGRRVAELVNGWRQAGVHEAVFDAANLASGVYIYRLTSGSVTMSGKMVLMK